MATKPLWDVDLSELEQRESDEQWHVTDKKSATWAMWMLQGLKQELRENDEVFQQEIERVTSWRDREAEKLNRHVAFFEEKLTMWHFEQLEKDPKGNKSIKLPYGTLKSRTTQNQPARLDDEALLEHLKSSGDAEYVLVKESVDWAEYKKTLDIVRIDGMPIVVDENGAMVPGLAVKVGETSFSVEVSD